MMAEVTPELVRQWAATKRAGGLPREIGYAYLRVCDELKQMTEQRDAFKDAAADIAQRYQAEVAALRNALDAALGGSDV